MFVTTRWQRLRFERRSACVAGMSLSKTRISDLRGLRLKKHRESAGQFVVEGAKVVGELTAAGFSFEAVYATSDWSVPPETLIPLTTITQAEMARISHYPTPSPVLAVGRITRPVLQSRELSRGFTLALDGIQDPGNVGTLLRIADWFGFDRVLLSPKCADLFSQKVINASMGSFARLRVITCDWAAAGADLGGIPVIGCDLTGTSIHEMPTFTSGLVVVGSEGQGLSPEADVLVTHRVTIRRHGHAESLNAAVAAGIVCAHLKR